MRPPAVVFLTQIEQNCAGFPNHILTILKDRNLVIRIESQKGFFALCTPLEIHHPGFVIEAQFSQRDRDFPPVGRRRRMQSKFQNTSPLMSPNQNRGSLASGTASPLSQARNISFTRSG